MPNTIDKCIIIMFSIVSNLYPCHPYMFITENCCSKFTIMSFWAPALNSPAETGIPKKSLDTSLVSPGNLLKDLLNNHAGKLLVVLIFDICNVYEIVAYDWLYSQY